MAQFSSQCPYDPVWLPPRCRLPEVASPALGPNVHSLPSPLLDQVIQTILWREAGKPLGERLVLLGTGFLDLSGMGLDGPMVQRSNTRNR